MLAGVGIAPTLISAFSLSERVVPAAALTEGLTWMTTALVIGFSAATWLSGRLVDSAGVPWAFAVATASGSVALLVVLGDLPAAAGHLTGLAARNRQLPATGRARLRVRPAPAT